MAQDNIRRTLTRETALFLGLLLFGMVVVPIAIYWIGPRVLGDFGGVGFSDFFGTLNARLLDADGGAWFVVLSPYLAVQSLRLAWLAWRFA